MPEKGPKTPNQPKVTSAPEKKGKDKKPVLNETKGKNVAKDAETQPKATVQQKAGQENATKKKAVI